jgi:diguanylate cyclase (GGDEF)-like protein
MRRGHIVLATLLLILWTAFLGYMAERETALAEGRLRDIALSQARALFNQVVDVRDWNSRHGGVYVPVTPETQPNPWLDVPHRDETTLAGRRLTLLNPAYMTRQLADLTRKRRGIGLHLTSLTPLRPGNEPDAWERAALESFERGRTERVEFVREAGGREVFRFMAPLPVEGSCLPCHQKQGYQIGQVRGGISVTYPSDLLVSSRGAFRRNVVLASAVLWLLGAGLVTAVTLAYHQKNLMVARLGELALVDDLTGLHNRRGFLLLAGQQLQIARRTGRPDLLVFVDLDGMKRINDELGHEAGDAALRRTAAVLQAAFRTSDIIARLGGDEFTVLCPNTGADSALTLVEGLEQHVGDANAGAAVPWRLSLSVGCAAFDPQRPVTLDELIHAADAAMYAAKQGKNVRGRGGQAAGPPRVGSGAG